MICFTDPSSNDSDNNGIIDSEEDFDLDNLNNLDEYYQKTSPYHNDTDFDNLSDFDEINTYHTNPLKMDTDDDGLNDDDELKMGSDPNNSDSDQNGIKDGDEVIEQKVTVDFQSHDEVISNISVKMKTTGNLEKNLSVDSVYGIDLLASDVAGLIGDPVEFEVETDFTSADITFTIDQ